MRGREAGANSSCSIPRQLQLRNCRVRVALRTRRTTRRYGSARASPPPRLRRTRLLCLFFLSPFLLSPPLCHCVKDFSANIRAGERLESIRNRSAKASSEGVRCRTRHRPLDLRRHVVVTAEEKDRSQPWGPLEPWIKTLDGSAGKCDVLCSTCC